MANTLNPGSIGSSSSAKGPPMHGEPVPDRQTDHDVVGITEGDTEHGMQLGGLLDQPDHLLGLIADVFGRCAKMEQASQRCGSAPSVAHRSTQSSSRMVHLVEPILEVADLGGQAAIAEDSAE